MNVEKSHKSAGIYLTLTLALTLTLFLKHLSDDLLRLSNLLANCQISLASRKTSALQTACCNCQPGLLDFLEQYQLGPLTLCTCHIHTHRRVYQHGFQVCQPQKYRVEYLLKWTVALQVVKHLQMWPVFA